jgi:hypothetical protein
MRISDLAQNTARLGLQFPNPDESLLRGISH